MGYKESLIAGVVLGVIVFWAMLVGGVFDGAPQKVYKLPAECYCECNGGPTAPVCKIWPKGGR